MPTIRISFSRFVVGRTHVGGRVGKLRVPVGGFCGLGFDEFFLYGVAALGGALRVGVRVVVNV